MWQSRHSNEMVRECFVCFFEFYSTQFLSTYMNRSLTFIEKDWDNIYTTLRENGLGKFSTNYRGKMERDLEIATISINGHGWKISCVCVCVCVCECV